MSFFNFNDILKGLLLSILYLQLTLANDTNIYNISQYTFFYIILIFCARLVDIDPNIITHAFITKTIFTLVDERIRQ